MVANALLNRSLITLSLLLPAAWAWGSDLAREKRLAEQIVDAIFDGEPLYLESDGHEFLTIYMEAADAPADRAVLLLHGRGYHPNWEQVTKPLRVGLTDYGWNTLSIQMPVLDKQAKYYDYISTFAEASPRINAAVEFLKARGNRQIIMVAHSCGVHMSMEWIRENGTPGIDGYIGIGMGATDYKQPMPEPFPFDGIQIPVLDLYGAKDYPAVLNGAAGRWAAITKQGHAMSRQQVLPDADHYMREQNGVLVETVADWLETAFPAP